ncbi:MAG: hypothetical protein WKF58_14070 [Ilumatobacteraceae bacterium]
MRSIRPITVVLVAAALVAAACSDKKQDEAIGTSPPVAGSTAAPTSGTGTSGTGTTPDGSQPGTAAPTTAPPILQPIATPAAPDMDPVRGGRIVVAGEAEVGAPWTPALVQCDAFCYRGRRRSTTR